MATYKVHVEHWYGEVVSTQGEGEGFVLLIFNTHHNSCMNETRSSLNTLCTMFATMVTLDILLVSSTSMTKERQEREVERGKGEREREREREEGSM